MRMAWGVKKQLGDPTAKYVKICEVENVHGSKIRRPFGFGYRLLGVDDWRVILFVTFITDTPPHGAGIVEVFENAKIAPDTRSSKFDSAVSQNWNPFGLEK